MASTFNEYQLQLALQTFEKDPLLSVRKAIRFYNIFHSTLSIRINDVSIRATTMINSRKLIALKEEVVVREIFDLDSRRFPLWIYDIEDIANRLLTIHDATRVGPYWASNFVKQQPELCTR